MWKETPKETSKETSEEMPKEISEETSKENLQEMTQLSKSIYDKAVSEELTIQEAIAFLEQQEKIRTLKEKLERFYKGKNLRRTLTEGLLHNHPNMSKDSIDRRVRGWLNDGSRSVRKSDAIEICFILKLSIEEADQLVAFISEEGLHWRNPDEIVFIFALKQGMDYLEALELNSQMSLLLTQVKEKKVLSKDSFTPIIRTEISALNTKEELADYLQHAAGRLGRCHNNAYRLFMEMLDALEHPQFYESLERAELFEEEHLTIREILKEYFYENNVLYAKEIVRESKKENSRLKDEEKRVFSAIQKNVSASWPDETTLSKMKSRKVDVTRKVLILLFLATDQGMDADEDIEEELTEEEIFEDLYGRLNDMLILCGFQTLDPRNPFDWLILYCICVQDIFDVDVRMRKIFKEMFGERKKEQENEEDEDGN